MSDGFNMPPPQPGPGGGWTPPGGQSADLGTRFLARLIDFILLGLIAFFLAMVLVFGVLFADAATGTPFMGGTGVAGFVASVISAVITIGYFALMESTGGQTLGKMIMSIHVSGPQGGPPSMGTAVKRNLWIALAIIPVVGSWLQLAAAIAIAVTINSSPTNTGWHDDFAGGTVVAKR